MPGPEGRRPVQLPSEVALVSPRVAYIAGWAILLGLGAGFVARWLVLLINLITSLSFYGRWSAGPVSPAGHSLGWMVMFVPILGGAIVGLMARYGSAAIRGHGIPEAMEMVLTQGSRIPPRVLFLKPISAAISIGTGGPFGAEGPIIATGGALGSLVGQFLKTTAAERKTLLAAGAAAGMAAIFASPISAVLLAVELLLFEFRARSIIPVALAAVSAMAMRLALFGSSPVFPMPALAQPGGGALACYVVVGGLVGLASVWTTRLLYWIEDQYDRLPVHWMWWPAIGAVVVGLVGIIEPRTMGVGYDNIEQILAGGIVGRALLVLGALKLVSWSFSLASGTSGGTLAPLFTIGGALGGLLGTCAAWAAPSLGVDPRLAGLVGMASIFAGASRALLASVVFAFETTREPIGLLPLLGGCTVSYMISSLMMRSTLMTEKIERRGIRVPSEYSADFMEVIRVRDVASRGVVTLESSESVQDVISWLGSGAQGSHHQSFPIVEDGRVIGVLTRRDLFSADGRASSSLDSLIKRPPVVIFEDSTLSEAVDHMVRERVGRLPVVSREAPTQVTGILSRGDILSAHERRLEETRTASRTFSIRVIDPRGRDRKNPPR